MSCIIAPRGGLYTALFGPERPRVIALVGAGGKTSAMTVLAQELTAAGRTVIITTTTKIHPPADSALLAQSPAQAREILARSSLVWAGTYADENKMTGPVCPLWELAAVADYVLFEADGARRHPLKMADRSREPVLPPETEAVVALAGLDAIGQPLEQVTHRPALACSALGVAPNHIISPADVAALLRLSYDPQYVILNKADTPERAALAQQTAACLSQARCVITSFHGWGLAEDR
jgi:molybdenum cofactor cytidylyltransferase